MLLTVKLVVVVPIDVDVLDCAQSCDGAATAAKYMRMWAWRYCTLGEIIIMKQKGEVSISRCRVLLRYNTHF